MMSKRWGLAAFGLIAALAIAWYFMSPWYTLKQMRDAAQANDADALAAYVDFPALREDMKSEIMAQFAVEAQKDKSGVGGLGTAMATAMIGPMIDGLVSPAGLRAAFIANRNREATQHPTSKATGAFDVSDKVEIERRSFDEFAVRNKSRPDGKMIFKRHGFGWRLSGVNLPAPASN